MQIRLQILLLLIFCAASLGLSSDVSAQSVAGRGSWQGHWNWAIYAEDKSELPPAYRDVEDVREIPAYALDLTLRKRGNRLSGSWGLVARYLARVDEGDLAATIHGNRATIRLHSNFGGAATIQLILRGDKLHWKLLRSSGENFFPKAEVLRRIRPGEKLPYVADDESEPEP
jgi:hypothetical protein